MTKLEHDYLRQIYRGMAERAIAEGRFPDLLIGTTPPSEFCKSDAERKIMLKEFKIVWRKHLKGGKP